MRLRDRPGTGREVCKGCPGRACLPASRTWGWAGREDSEFIGLDRPLGSWSSHPVPDPSASSPAPGAGKSTSSPSLSRDSPAPCPAAERGKCGCWGQKVKQPQNLPAQILGAGWGRKPAWVCRDLACPSHVLAPSEGLDDPRAPTGAGLKGVCRLRGTQTPVGPPRLVWPPLQLPSSLALSLATGLDCSSHGPQGTDPRALEQSPPHRRASRGFS